MTVFTKADNSGYWERVRKTLAEFYKPGDYIHCVNVFKRQNSTCQLCSHTPITWNHVLRNARTSRRLVVGRICVIQYKVGVEKMGYDGTVNYLPQFRREAELINARYPGTAKIISPEDTSEAEHRIEGYDWVDGYYLEDSEIFDANSLAAEGLGGDEIDWDSHDYE